MKNFKLITFSKIQRNKLLKGCLYFDFDGQDCLIDVCASTDYSNCASGLDVCYTDTGDCGKIDVCSLSDNTGDCTIDVCFATDNDSCYANDDGGDGCFLDYCELGDSSDGKKDK